MEDKQETTEDSLADKEAPATVTQVDAGKKPVEEALTSSANQNEADNISESPSHDFESQDSSFSKSEESVADAAILDPYHYLTRRHFTSEIFKIEIQNLPRHFGFAQLKKMLNGLQLKPKKVKAVNKATYAFVTFSCEEDKEEALKVLNGHKWKGQILRAKLAKPVKDPYTESIALKRSQEESEENSKEAKKRKEEDNLPVEERLNSIVTPLWNQPYEEQLSTKQNNTREFLCNLSKMLQRNILEMSAWLAQQRKNHSGMACQLEPIKQSPVLESYRNKCEFTIGKSVEAKDNTVGFRLGAYKGGHVSVVNPSSCCHICPSTKAVVNSFQQYIQQESSLSSYDTQLHCGHWGMLLVRTSLDGGKMAAACMHPQDLSKEVIDAEKQKLRHYFQEGEGQSCQLTSLYLSLQGESKSYEHLAGDEHITEELLGLKFRISPDAFFQVNTKAAEVLYTAIADWAEVTPDTTVLDICCGTGTIGITLAKRVKKVIGIEMNQQAVEDAVFNAKANNLSNVEYVCGKAEVVLPDMTPDLRRCDNVVGIVDPPRPGMPTKVLQAIRRCANLRRLIYVSCHPQNAINNFIDLCRPVSNRNKGIPFRPTKAVAVDLFPHTKHCELIILFERADRVDSFYEVPEGVQRSGNISSEGPATVMS
ncbi:tRNA (uracil-5-)-methyltransferase homolog A-like isoform X2 [Acanthaster planci]|uniref:tRNA (uracil(54)-C(5))-methyltransferase n=1 Tax=Acanthaster planci TaxID=133434 RepID=A0A8B7ZJV8_ACAPL|nr:tRNA (uracil-5-)-methyltransferase homolog A-like isoform X2 [Acanthaster planci]